MSHPTVAQFALALGCKESLAIVTRRLGALGLAETCSRCGGTGRFSFNMMDGDRCYGCGGLGIVAPKRLTGKLLATVQAKVAAGELAPYLECIRAEAEVRKLHARIASDVFAAYEGNALLAWIAARKAAAGSHCWSWEIDIRADALGLPVSERHAVRGDSIDDAGAIRGKLSAHLTAGNKLRSDDADGVRAWHAKLAEIKAECDAIAAAGLAKVATEPWWPK